MATSPITELPPASPVPSGLLAGRYQLLSVLGRGAMGEVYKARHVHAGRVVALKVVSAELASDERICERVRAEARACSAARHPNIVEVFDAGELEDGRPYVAMEFLEGRQLLALFESEGPLPVARACRIMLQVTRAIAAAHKVGIIHRDLKAENVMLVAGDGGETAKVLDFGIAAALDPEGGRVTRAGIGMGTPEYMAPEQIYGAKPTPRCDIYALGVLLFEGLSGALPFCDDQPSAILQRKATTPAPPIAERRPDLPEPLAKLIDECLALDPEHRPSTADELARVLEAYVDEAPAVPAAAVRRRGGLVMVVGVPVLVTVMTSLVALVLLRPNPQTSVPALAGLAAVVDAIPPAIPAGPTVAPIEPAMPAAVSAPTAVVADPPAVAPIAAPTDRPKLAGTAAPKQPRRDPDVPTPGSNGSVAKPDPRPDPATSEECASIRAKADDARSLPNWDALARLTKDSTCWASSRDRARLHVKALFELGRLEECKSAAGSFKDSEIQKIAKNCEAKLKLKEPG